MDGRKPISKKLRFEVLKRDSFTCQYCGARAPDAILVVDHITPVASGGESDILNLITACRDCNAGKAARELSDQAVLTKQIDTLSDLQARRELIQEMIDWKRGLASIDADASISLVDFWIDLVSPHTITHQAAVIIAVWIRQYGAPAVLDAMTTAINQYARYEDGELTVESADTAFFKIPGILHLRAKGTADDPRLKTTYYIRGILRKRLDYRVEWAILDLVPRCLDAGYTADRLISIAKSAQNWAWWCNAMVAFAEEAEGDG